MARRVERRTVTLEKFGLDDVHLVRPGRRSGRFIWLREGSGVPPYRGKTVRVEIERGLDGVWRFVAFCEDGSQ